MICVDSIYKNQKIIQFPAKIIYGVDGNLLQINDLSFC